MLSVTITLNGRPLRPGDLKAVLEKAAIESVTSQIRQRLQHVRCATHGRAPTVVGSGPSLEHLRFQVTACCEELREATLKAIGAKAR